MEVQQSEQLCGRKDRSLSVVIVTKQKDSWNNKSYHHQYHDASSSQRSIIDRICTLFILRRQGTNALRRYIILHLPKRFISKSFILPTSDIISRFILLCLMTPSTNSTVTRCRDESPAVPCKYVNNDLVVVGAVDWTVTWTSPLSYFEASCFCSPFTRTATGRLLPEPLLLSSTAP
jgi:hypothetical protein